MFMLPTDISNHSDNIALNFIAGAMEHLTQNNFGRIAAAPFCALVFLKQ
jgi:hypothetical protein